jgi:integrase
VYGRTEKEARMKQRQAMQDKDAGSLVLDSMTVEAWFTYWLDHIAKRRLKPQTLRGYRSHINNSVIPAIGRKRLTDLRPAHLRGMYDTMRDRGLAEATVRQVHAIVKKALKDAERDGKLARNPADRVDPPGTATNERRSLSIDEARRVLDAAHDDARWWLAIFYGMRQGECLGLRWQDVDFDRHVIRVEQTLQWGADYSPSSGHPSPRHRGVSSRSCRAWKHGSSSTPRE